MRNRAETMIERPAPMPSKKPILNISVSMTRMDETMRTKKIGCFKVSHIESVNLAT